MAYDALVIGGGMAGLAAAWRLGQAGYRTALIEASDQLGGLASSFEKDDRLYPLGYHHILSTDAHLLSLLAQLGLLERLHAFGDYRLVQVLAQRNGRLDDPQIIAVLLQLGNE